MRAGLVLAAWLGVGGACTADSLPEGRWQVIALGPSAIEVADGVTVSLSDGQASGRSGCNRFTGSYSVDGPAFSFGPLAATRIACRGRAAEVEALFNTVIGSVTGWERDGETLVLMSDALPVLRAVPRLDPVER